MDLERTMFARRFVQVQERCKQNGKREKKIPFAFRNDKKHRKETEKEISKGKDPKVQIRQESQRIRSAPISRWDTAKRNVHVIIGTHQHVHTRNAHWRDTCVFKHKGSAGEEQTDGQGTIATKIGRITGILLVY